MKITKADWLKAYEIISASETLIAKGKENGYDLRFNFSTNPEDSTIGLVFYAFHDSEPTFSFVVLDIFSEEYEKRFKEIEAMVERDPVEEERARLLKRLAELDNGR